MNEFEWQKGYDTGNVLGSSQERIRVLGIIYQLVKEAGDRSIGLSQQATCCRFDDIQKKLTLLALKDISLREQKLYVELMGRINE